MNVTNHISETLDLPLPFVQESVVHDPAHRVEVAANDVKKGKKIYMVTLKFLRQNG